MTGPVRRTLAAFAGLVVALIGFAVTATPAQAALDPVAELKAYGVCDVSTGEWVITWKLTNKDAKSATLSNVMPSQNTALSNIDHGAVVGPNTTVSGIQRFAGSVTGATLAVDATWAYDPTVEVTVNGSWGNNGIWCSTTSQCTQLGPGVLKHTFTASNGSPTTSATVWRNTTNNKPVMSLCGAQKLTLVSYYALSASFALPQYVFDHVTQDFTKTTYELSFQVAMPPCFTQSDFVTGEKIDPLTGTLYGDRKIGSGGAPGNISTGPHGWFNGNGTSGGVCANPAATVTPKCDGSGTVHLSNGLNAPFAPVTFTWTLNGAPGGADSPKAVAPKSSYSFAVISSQFPVEVTGSNGYQTTLNWSWPPTDCAQPTLLVASDCTNLILKVTNPNSTTVDATANYNGASQTKPVTKGNTTIFTFPAGTGSATITIGGAPYWEPLTASFTDSDSCNLADTGTSVTTVIVVGSSLAAAGALLIYVVARSMGRRRRAA